MAKNSSDLSLGFEESRNMRPTPAFESPKAKTGYFVSKKMKFTLSLDKIILEKIRHVQEETCDYKAIEY